MKRIIIFHAMIAILSLTSCHQKEVRKADVLAADSIHTSSYEDSEKAFEAFAAHFSETASFAYAEVSGRRVLLVSQETFGNNVNSDKEAIEATIFALDKKGKIISLGSIRSQGTLYPVTLLEGKLAVAGHQFVKVYGIRGDVPELELVSQDEGYGPEMDPKFEAFAKGTPVKFKQKLTK